MDGKLFHQKRPVSSIFNLTCLTFPLEYLTNQQVKQIRFPEIKGLRCEDLVRFMHSHSIAHYLPTPTKKGNELKLKKTWMANVSSIFQVVKNDPHALGLLNTKKD